MLGETGLLDGLDETLLLFFGESCVAGLGEAGGGLDESVAAAELGDHARAALLQYGQQSCGLRRVVYVAQDESAGLRRALGRVAGCGNDARGADRGEGVIAVLHVRYDVANIGCGDDAPMIWPARGDGIVVIGDEVPAIAPTTKQANCSYHALSYTYGLVSSASSLSSRLPSPSGSGEVGSRVAANLVAIIQPVAVRVGIHRIGHRIRLVRVGDAVTIRIDQCGVRDEPSGDNHLGAVGVVSVVEAVDLLAVGDAVAVRVGIVLVEFERDAVEQHEMVSYQSAMPSPSLSVSRCR